MGGREGGEGVSGDVVEDESRTEGSCGTSEREQRTQALAEETPFPQPVSKHQKRLDSDSSSTPSIPRLPSHSGTETCDLEPRPTVQELKFENEALQYQVRHLKKQRSNLQEENELLVHKLSAGGNYSGGSSGASPARSGSPTSFDDGLTGFASDLMNSFGHVSSSSSSSTPPPPVSSRIPPKPAPPVSSAPAITANQKVPSHSAPAPRQPLASQMTSPAARCPTEGQRHESERMEEEGKEEGRRRQLARMQLGRLIERVKAQSPDSAVHSTETVPQPSTSSAPCPALPLSTSSDASVPHTHVRMVGEDRVDGGGEGVRGEGVRRVWGRGEGKEVSQPPVKPQRMLRAESRDEGGEGRGTTRGDERATKADSAGSMRPGCGEGGSDEPMATKDDRRQTHPSETEKPAEPVSSAGTGRFARVSSGGSAVSEIARQFMCQQEGERGKPSLSSMSESDEVFVTRERSGAVIESTTCPLPREMATESQSSAGTEGRGTPGVYAKRTAIKSDHSWIRRKSSSDEVDSDRSSVFTQSQPTDPPSPVPSRPARAQPYRTHAVISTVTPTSQPARPPYPHAVKSSYSQSALPSTTYQVHVHQSTRPTQPPIKAHSKTKSHPELPPSRGRADSASGKKGGKGRGRGMERNPSLPRSASEESLTSNVLKRSGEKVAPATSTVSRGKGRRGGGGEEGEG